MADLSPSGTKLEDELSLILSYAATRIENCGGIHVSICGDAGSGKSHVVDTVSKILPQGTVISGRYSNICVVGRTDRPGTPLISVPGISQTSVSKKEPAEIDENYGVPVDFQTVSRKQIYWEPAVYQNSTCVDVYSMDRERLEYWMEQEDRL